MDSPQMGSSMRRHMNASVVCVLPFGSKTMSCRVFGCSGQLCNQLIGQEGGKDGCRHVTEREEDFFVLGLDVKGKRTITESLQLYVKGEVRKNLPSIFMLDFHVGGRGEGWEGCCASTNRNAKLILNVIPCFDVSRRARGILAIAMRKRNAEPFCAYLRFFFRQSVTFSMESPGAEWDDALCHIQQCRACRFAYSSRF